MTSPTRRSRHNRNADDAPDPEVTTCGAVRSPCRTAFTTSSAMMISASSLRYPRPQQVSSSRTNWRAVLASSGTGLSGRLVTEGVSHQAEGTGRNCGGEAAVSAGAFGLVGDAFRNKPKAPAETAEERPLEPG